MNSTEKAIMKCFHRATTLFSLALDSDTSAFTTRLHHTRRGPSDVLRSFGPLYQSISNEHIYRHHLFSTDMIIILYRANLTLKQFYTYIHNKFFWCWSTQQFSMKYSALGSLKHDQYKTQSWHNSLLLAKTKTIPFLFSHNIIFTNG